jgi:hypothetical protein
MFETYIAVASSKIVARSFHFRIGCIYTSMNASLKSKRNESEEVYFGYNFVASVLLVKHPRDFDGWY